MREWQPNREIDNAIDYKIQNNNNNKCKNDGRILIKCKWQRAACLVFPLPPQNSSATTHCSVLLSGGILSPFIFERDWMVRCREVVREIWSSVSMTVSWQNNEQNNQLTNCYISQGNNASVLLLSTVVKMGNIEMIKLEFIFDILNKMNFKKHGSI